MRIFGDKGLRGVNDEWRSHLGLHADGKLYWTAPDFGGSQPDMAAPVERIILLVDSLTAICNEWTLRSRWRAAS